MMTRRMNNGMLELLDGNGVVVGTRPASDQEIREWGDFIGTRPASEQDIRAWGDFIWKHLGSGDNPNCVAEKGAKEKL
jgi:hypothetical protein